MDDMVSGVDPDELLMELEEGDGSELEEEEEDLPEDPIPSPFQLPSSGPGSTATSTASSPPNNDDMQAFNFSGKPLSIKRGRGRPRREEGKPLSRRSNTANRPKKWKPSGLKGLSKKVKSFEGFDFASILPSPCDEFGMLDPETGALIYPERDKLMPAPEELPYAPEQWPGKVCAFCNLNERSQLGQGELLRLNCPDGFTPQQMLPGMEQVPIASTSGQGAEREPGDKSPRGPVTCRRQKSFSKCRPSVTNEYVEELTVIGYLEVPEVQSLFETTGYFYVHRNCALWTDGVIKNDNSSLENVGYMLLKSVGQKCSFCNHYGASLVCKAENCTKMYHFPCATASGAFQELSSVTLFCSQHLSEVPNYCDETSACYTCKILGDIANLMFCSSCGEHYHGTCVGLAQLPGVRAGWQCRKCKVCQVCRMGGDESKLMACEQCDKVYHSVCQRPIVTTIPKYGWKCRCCRVCGDCGSRTPGAGLSSRWHAHYTVCDSCYQQRNKGFSCPLCHRAYRAHANREMVQCTSCRKFVHGGCDPDADLLTYHQRKENCPDYEYVCLNCKNSTQPGRQLLAKRNSIDDCMDSLSASQESLYDDNLDFDSDQQPPEDTTRIIGLGKGKPYSASKIAKKRLSLSSCPSGRPKGIGKTIPAGKVGYMKRQRLAEFGRKRGPKAKMRGVFGVPGVGLQRPVSDGSKTDEEPGVENKLVLCSAKDKYILTQDLCVMCGAMGTDQEGCLIACVQCGQCYHPYCVNVKVTKVILQKGWRCLDCTVCEGCGQRNDESRLILCDECDISYHIYCMDPPLDYVPHGNWKCKWCAICQTCGATDPGFNCTWMNSCSECGPCASQKACPSCQEPYGEGDLIVQCVQCERWLHGACDNVKTEADAEKCAEEGYNCVLCRPRDVPPPHLVPRANMIKPPTPTKSPEMKANNASYCIDGVLLSERGHNMIKALSAEQQITRKKRKKVQQVHDKEAGIMATIESVVAGSNSGLDDAAKLEMMDIKEDPQEIYKEGMIWTKEDGPPPEGFTVFTMESGVAVLRRKRQRNLQKLGIGGFLVRVRGIKTGQENDDVDMLPGQNLPPEASGLEEKPRRKPVRRKPRSKLAESFPPYLQEAFFGKELLDSHKEANSSSSGDEEKSSDKIVHLSQDEVKDVIEMPVKQEKSNKHVDHVKNLEKNKAPLVPKEEDESDTEALKDVLALPGDLLDNDLVNTIMNEDDDELAKNDTLESFTDSNLPDDSVAEAGNANNAKDAKDDLSDILGSHFNLESIPNINSKDVEDIFKGVLTDESQESQESNAYSLRNNVPFTPGTSQPIHSTMTRPTSLTNVNQSTLNSPMSFPSQSPYHSEYSNSPQFSPAFSEPPSPWVSVNEPGDLDAAGAGGGVSTCNQRSSEKMKADEGLGAGATISAVLYVNVNHPEWKTEYPNWSDRYKQIIKKWRTLSAEQKRPYLQKARDNRSELRLKKQKQSQASKESASSPGTPKPPPAPPVAAAVPPATSAAPLPVSEVCTPQHGQSRPVQPLLTTTTTTASTTTTISSVSVVSPPNNNNINNNPPPPSAKQQQQFTVHGQFLGSGEHCHGPAPNVTVNPLYQPQARSEHGVTPPPPPPPPALKQAIVATSSAAAAAADQQIRVLTPSEIMRTLPSLCQENYDSQPLDQEKLALQQKSAREAEQERQWKLMQAQRQQQAQQTNHVIQEQRVQAIARVQRQISDSSQQFVDDQQNLMKAQAPQEPTPITSAPISRQFLPGFGGSVRQDCAAADVNRQLRDLLQKQQFKKIDDQLIAGKTQQRIWPPVSSESLPQEQQQQQQQQQEQTAVNVDATFRQPLPPGIVRPRLPMPQAPMIRQRLPGTDPRLQLATDPRMRQLLQQRGVINIQQQQSAQMMRFPQSAGVRMGGVEHSSELHLLQDQKYWQNKHEVEQQLSKQQINQSMAQQQQGVKSASSSNNTEQEIPDNVTAELEKLEEESGTMVELHSVGDILGGLGEDDDDILAEMGADFNILEYADPELEALRGEKTNILDNLDLVEPEPDKDDKREAKQQQKMQSAMPQAEIKSENEVTQNLVTSHVSVSNLQPPPLAVAQPQSTVGHPQFTNANLTQISLQQQHQQMLQQVQQAAAMGRPIAPGTKLMSPDGVVGIVTPNNTVSLTLPPNYPQRMLNAQLHQLQNSKLQMRPGQNTRIITTANNPLHANLVGLNQAHRLNMGQQVAPPAAVAPPPPPPPPPPYPGPPPPYPGSSSQMGLNMGPSSFEPLRLPMGYMHPPCPQGTIVPHMQRRTLLLEEQPLLLEELLEQEKREQEKQLQTQTGNNQEIPTTNSESDPSLLNDQDFVKLKVDVLSSAQVILPTTVSTQVRNTFINRTPAPNVNMQWQQQQQQQQQPCQQPTTPTTAAPQPVVNEPAPPRVPTFNATLLPAPPLPPENIVTDQDKQAQMLYEQWLKHQNVVLTQQLKFYETEVQKLRKSKKSLNSKQRQLRKSGNQLGDADAMELQRISTEQAILQKHLESSRKQTRQHGMLIQEYQNKQQIKHTGQMQQSPLLAGQQIRSPLGPPSSSPLHTPQSPMMSPSPTASHNSPLNSPGPLVSPSPNVIQSPTPNMSPRIGTPHSQGAGGGDSSPVRSPSHGNVCLPPPPAPRMTSPQHRRLVTSPLGYVGEVRGGQQVRFSRQVEGQQRVRLNSPVQKVGGSPLSSPPPQGLIQQQQQQPQQQRQLIFRQQTTQQTLTPQQYQLIIQHQLAKQQQLQQQQQQQQQQNRMNLNLNQPNSPIPPPKSPLVQTGQNIMSPHSQPPSPMPPRSPMLNFNNINPNSPMPRSPIVQQSMQPNSPMMPSSPMLGQSPMGGMRRTPSANSSPAMPDRPTSVENPRTPYGMQNDLLMSLQQQQEEMNGSNNGGGGHHGNNPIPLLLEYGYEYFKPGLRGGAPMWNLNRKRDDESGGGTGGESNVVPKQKRESHLNKVSILKKKSPMKVSVLGAQKVAAAASSLVSTDYNELEDSNSCTPPVTPPPVASTSKIGVQKVLRKTEQTELKDQTPVLTVDSSPEGKDALDDIMDYEEDNDDSVVSGEVTLSSAAQQNDGDEIAVIETFSQNDISDVMSSPLESDQIADEFVLFHGNMVVDISGEAQFASDKEEEDDEYQEDMDKNMQIVNVAIQSPTTSEEELIMQGKTKRVTSGGLTLNIVQGLSSNHLLAVSDSPEQEPNAGNSPEQDEELSNFEDSEIVIIDPTDKSPEEQISTKEDFEELIDEGSRKEKIIKSDSLTGKHISEMHKYTSYSPKQISKPQNTPKKVSLITTQIENKKSANAKQIEPRKTASIILPVKQGVRSNIINVPKLVTSVSPAITIVSASTSQIASILPSHFTVPVISASAVSKLANVKVIDKPSTSLSLTATNESLPKKIFEDDSVSSDNSEDAKEKKSPDCEKTPHFNNLPKNKIEKTTTDKKPEVSQQTEEQKQETPTATASNKPALVHSTPELKMTAQVIQEGQMHAQNAETSFVSSDTGSCDLDSKSVVISIPSPTPSQEQMLNNIALQALENRRRDGGGIPGEFESFEDVLDMIENITGEPPTVIEEMKDKLKVEESEGKGAKQLSEIVASRASVAAQLSPLSQPAELTSNMANVSQQLRSLLSSLHTTTATGTSNVETTSCKSVIAKETCSSSNSRTEKNLIVTKQKTTLNVSSTIATSTTGNLTPRTVGRIKLMPDHPKLPTVVTPTITTTTTTSSAKTTTTTVRKSLSLNAMLQSHPAATTPQTSPGTITTASILGSSLGIIKSGFNTSLAQAHPKVEPVTSTLQSAHLHGGGGGNGSLISTSQAQQRPVATNLLHTHLTKTLKATEEQSEDSKNDVNEVKSGALNVLTTASLDLLGKNFTVTNSTTSRLEDSQNVLLKQLLQNTACASIGTPSSTTTTPTPTAPSLPIVPNLEAQLARPVPPTPTSLLPPILQNDPPKTQQQQQPRPTTTPSTFTPTKPEQTTVTAATQQLHIDTKKCLPPSRTPSRDDLLSPQTPRSSDSSLQTPPLLVKKEASVGSAFVPQEVKKELVDESSQHSEVSDHSRNELNVKEELEMDTEKSFAEQKEELKKMKRRAYQQKRRQNHIMNKEMAGQPKKRPRKSSKVDEDYDGYIDGVLAQLRSLPPMTVSEPILNKNYMVVPIFGSGDLTKLGTKDYTTRSGDLSGSYGNAIIPDVSDFYNTKPYADAEPLPEKTPASTQRGFYDQEFPIIKFDTDEDRKFDLFCRDDSPDSIVSSSSPECVYTDPSNKFPGLRLISDDEDDDEDAVRNKRASPVVPIIAPIPIRLKPAGPYLKDYPDVDKENMGSDYMNLKNKYGSQPSTPLKDTGNVTVTLTLTSSAAEDIMGVLRDLANILHIPAPTSYQIVERTSTPPSQKLGLYRTKGKDGKEGAPIDIQSILNGAAKFCRHCDVVILNNMIKKKVSDLPFLAKDSDFLGEDDDLFFCSSTCFMQFSLMHRSPSITEDKAAAIIEHLCLKEKIDSKKTDVDNFGRRKMTDPVEIEKHEITKKDYQFEPMEINSISFEKHFQLRNDDNFQFRLDKNLPQKTHKGVHYKYWTPGCLPPRAKYKKPTDKEIMELLYKMNITVTPQQMPEDTRKCMFCHCVSDGVADGPARLLNFDVDKWVHLNCGLWSDGVYETVNGALMNLENALQQSLTTQCVHCNTTGATIRCFKTRCSNVYHLGCAVKDSCVFYKNKTVYCAIHASKNDKDNELTTLSVSRRVYVNRDENRQVAAVMHHSDTSNLLRVGSLIFLNVGQLLPHQLHNFHTSNYIYPIGYKIIRFYWSMRRVNKRCKYVCSIQEVSGRPEFRVLVQEPYEEDVEFRDATAKGVWNKILEPLSVLRKESGCIQIFPRFVTGEDLFGLTEPAVVRVLESLPGIETLSDYKFKYGRNPLLELPLAINPSGAARTEPRLKNQLHWKRPHTQRTGSSVRPVFVSSASGGVAGEAACPYSKQFVHSKSSQYKKMKQEWRNNVYLARSKIQGLGLYAARELEKHTMVIEYIGEIIRTELAETREKKYEAKNRGIYMFRLDEERVVDATLSGGLARYINHSCNPNCVAEIVEVDRDLRIIIFAKRRIQRGEELAYDYKFDIEDDQHKISCMCGAPNCRKWMN